MTFLDLVQIRGEIAVKLRSTIQILSVIEIMGIPLEGSKIRIFHKICGYLSQFFGENFDDFGEILDIDLVILKKVWNRVLTHIATNFGKF